MTTMDNLNKKALIQADAVIDDAQNQLGDALKKQALCLNTTPSLKTNSLHQPKNNHILAALPVASLIDLSQHLQLVLLPMGKML